MLKRATESVKVVPESVLSNGGRENLLGTHNQKGLSPAGGGLSPYTVDLGALDTFRCGTPIHFPGHPTATHTRCRAATVTHVPFK